MRAELLHKPYPEESQRDGLAGDQNTTDGEAAQGQGEAMAKGDAETDRGRGETGGA